MPDDSSGGVAPVPEPEHTPEPEHIPEPASDLDRTWQEDFDRRLAEMQAALVELSQRATGYAPHDHQHPLDPAMATLAEALAEDERLEQSPERKRWWQRKLTLHGVE